LSPIRNLSLRSISYKIVVVGSALTLMAVAARSAPPGALSATSSAGTVAPAAELASAVTPAAGQLTPRQIARSMLHLYGWRPRQFPYLNELWAAESGWNVYAVNPYSGAYGIPQAVPGSKMASAGPAWRTDPATQIRWGLGYIKQVYGSPRSAWLHEEAYDWY
jgi:resuscitation-promoting factor RpfB